MSNFVFNIAKGKAGQYFQNVKDGSPANSRIIVVPIEATGVEADDALKDHNTLDELLTAANNEQATMGRKTVAAADLTLTVDDTTNLLKVEMADQTWAAATGNAISDLLLCYDPDNTAGDDTTIIPLTCHDFSVTPDGSDVVGDVGANGVYQATEPA